MKRLVVTAFWAEDPDMHKIEDAFRPLKVEDTDGYVIAYSDKDPMAGRTYNAIRAAHETKRKAEGNDQ